MTAGSATAAALITGADIKNNTVASADLKDNSAASADIKNNSIASADIKDGTVASADLKNNNIAGGDIKDGVVASADLKNNSVTSADIADGTVSAADLKNNSVTSADIADGTITAADLSAAAYSGPNWSIVDRNVIGNGDSYLRAGPNPPNPPDGIGSLGIRTGSPDDAAAFGNQVDFVGDSVNDLTNVGYSVYTTGENNSLAPNNMPSIKIEIDPNLDDPASNFTTMVYVPDNGPPGQWSTFDADADPEPHWGLTGAAFAGTVCDINGPRCTFEQLIDYLDDGAPDGVILTVQIGKGRDFAFSGAVDSLVVNDQKFDFEPFGVITKTP